MTVSILSVKNPLKRSGFDQILPIYGYITIQPWRLLAVKVVELAASVENEEVMG